MHNSNLHLTYRPDIDGLRAIAILAVVIFHAFPKLIPGGFIGVDVFFVISGFLISSIIFSNLKNDKFSFLDFYKKRIKRIFPALILVLVTSFSIGYFILLPDEFKQLGKHIVAGAFFSQNFILWQEAGYFDTASETKPLMHLWSLAIEEQYYLLYPVLIAYLWKTKKNIPFTLVVLSIASFISCVVFTYKNPSMAFFIPITRIWELLAGSLLAYANIFYLNKANDWPYKNTYYKNAVSIVGLVLIIIAAFTIDKTLPFPGWLSLLPVLGAVLLIHAGNGAVINRAVLSNRLMIFIGLISYPLYLWHWPLLSFLQIVKSENEPASYRVIAVLVSVFLAWGTYRIFENPIRFKFKSKLVAPYLTIALTAIAGTGLYIFLQDGLQSREVVKANAIITTGQISGDLGFLTKGCGVAPDDEGKFGDCMRDSRSTPSFLLLGDSKASALSAGIFLKSSKEKSWTFIGGNGPNGAPIMVLSNNQLYEQYQTLSKIALEAVTNDTDIKVVVLTVATRALFQLKTDYTIEDLPENPNFDVAYVGLKNAITKMIDAGKKVVLVVDNPSLKDPKQCITRKTAFILLDNFLSLDNTYQCHISYESHLKTSEKYRKLLESIRELNPEMIYIYDPLHLLCDIQQNKCTTVLNGKLLYGYSDHISPYTSMLIAEELVPFVEKIAK